jgi:hypothetical protein
MSPVADMTPAPSANRTANDHMDPIEAQSRAMIASALIMRGAVAVPVGGAHLLHADGLRLRELTDDVYRLLTAPQHDAAIHGAPSPQP